MPDETLRQTSINYIGWGIANVMHGEIYLHKKLQDPQYETLRNKIIEHEKGHSPSSQYGLWDMIHDQKHASIDVDLIYFILTTPSSWLQFSPIIYHNRQLIIDRQTIYLYSIIAITAGIGWIIF